jgi:hypothetical protein
MPVSLSKETKDASSHLWVNIDSYPERYVPNLSRQEAREVLMDDRHDLLGVHALRLTLKQAGFQIDYNSMSRKQILDFLKDLQ